MYRSRLILTPLLLTALLPLIHCGGSQHAADEKYYLVATNVKVPYWQQAQAGLSKVAAELQVQTEMVGPDAYDPKAEHEEFRRILSKNPSGILISVSDPNVMKDDIEDALRQGIPVITIDSDAPDTHRLMFVGTDNYNAGAMGGRVVDNRLQGKGSVVVFTIEGQGNLNDRLNGYKDVFGRAKDIKISEVIDMKGDARIAFDKTVELLEKEKKSPFDAVVCLEAIACPEVAEVLDRKQVKGKVVVAMDTDQRTLDAIQRGTISATIGQKPFTMAFMGVKLLDDLHHHPLKSLTASWSRDSFSPIPAFVDTGATLIDRSNVDSFLKSAAAATAPPKK